MDVFRAELIHLRDEYPLSTIVANHLPELLLLLIFKLGAVPAGKDQTLDVCLQIGKELISLLVQLSAARFL